jgi:hypothetical protein
MTETDHQNELKEVKAKAFKILEEEGVLRALEIVLNENYDEDDLLEEFSSPIKEVAAKTDIEAEHGDNKHWTHHAYLLGGVQKIQISYYSSYSTFSDDMDKKAKLYVFNNDEIVLYDRGSAEKKYNGWGSDPWSFSKNGAMWLEVVKLNKVWMGALKEIASELQRVGELDSEEYRRSQEERAEKKKSNFDLGDF